MIQFVTIVLKCKWLRASCSKVQISKKVLIQLQQWSTLMPLHLENSKESLHYLNDSYKFFRCSIESILSGWMRSTPLQNSWWQCTTYNIIYNVRMDQHTRLISFLHSSPCKICWSSLPHLIVLFYPFYLNVYDLYTMTPANKTGSSRCSDQKCVEWASIRSRIRTWLMLRSGARRKTIHIHCRLQPTTYSSVIKWIKCCIKYISSNCQPWTQWK